MNEIRISISDALKAVEEVMSYFSGKRAGDTGEYFRYAACEADRRMLMQLLEEASGWIDLSLGRHGGGYSIKTDDLIFGLREADGV